jgi:uncharacterized protein (PEP-CTERM system associated)
MNTVTANTVIDAMTRSRRTSAFLFSAALISAPAITVQARAEEAAGVVQPTQEDAGERAAESSVEAAPPLRPKPFPHPAALGAPLLQRPGAVPPAAAVPPPPFLIKLGVAGEEKATDNVRAAPGASKKSDLITSVTPSLGLSFKTGKLDLHLSYELGYDRYAVSKELDGFRHNGLGVLNAELIKRILFVDSRFSVSEQNVNPTGPTAADGRTTATDRTRATTFSVTPRLEQRLGRWAVGQVSYRHDETRYDTPSTDAATLIGGGGGRLSDSRGDAARLALRNGEEFSRLFWDYSFENSRREQNDQTLKQKTHDLGVEYRISEKIGVLAEVGHDDIHGGGVDSAALSGFFYSGGLHWTPSPDFDLRIGWGERNGADNFYVLGDYKLSPMTVLRVSHKTDITTDAMAAVEALAAVQRDPTGAYINPFSGVAADPGASPFIRSDAIYRRSVSSAILSHTDDRETIFFSVSMAKQTVVGGLDIGPAAIRNAARGTVNTTVSLGLGWTHLLTPTTSIAFTGGRDEVVESNAPTGKSRRYRAGVGLSRQINPLLSADVSYRFADWKPETGPRIRENMIIFGLRKRI